MHITSRSGRVGEEKPIRLCFNAGSPSSGASGESKIPGQGFGEIASTCKVPIKTQTYRLLLAELALRCARPRALGRLRAV